MTEPLRARREFLLASLGASAALLAGCGQGEYDLRMSNVGQSMARRGADAAANRLEAGFHSITDSTGPTGIKFRRPQAFVPPKGKQLGAAEAGAKFAQVDIPGFCYTLQATLADNNNGQIPAYCYVFAAPKATTPIETVKGLLTQALAPVAPNMSWTTGNVGGLPMNSATAAGNFDFEVNGAPQSMAGTMSISLVEGAEKFVMIAFRYENASAKKNDLPVAISESIQSLSADGPAPAPGPAPPGPMAPGPMPPGPMQPPGPPGPAGS